jgi:hypothetical protein
MNAPALIDHYRDKLIRLIGGRQFDNAAVSVNVKPLTPEEAIGSPSRKDYPILEGQERIIEAEVLGTRGQAFTDAPSDFSGRLRDVLELPLNTNSNRAVFLATTNALLHSLAEVDGVLHCKDDEPQRCAADIALAARQRGTRRVGLIGLNPSFAEALVGEFGADAVHITDLNPKNLGTRKFGVTIWDGRTQTRELIQFSDLVIVTGTTLVNGTFDGICSLAIQEQKPVIVFGISAAGFCKLMSVERWCAQACLTAWGISARAS